MGKHKKLIYNNRSYCIDCPYISKKGSNYYCTNAEQYIGDISICPENCFNHDTELKEWIVPVIWQMNGNIKVKAKTAEEAYEKVKKDSEDYPFPKEKYYVCNSFGPAINDICDIEIATDDYNKGRLKL